MAETKIKPEQAIPTRFKIGSFTRDLSAAGGNVAYTGVGFKPSSVIFFATFPGVSMSVGASDSTAGNGVYYRIGAGSNVNGFTNGAATNASFYLESAANQYQAGSITSYDADGFTLTWSKANSPTGTGSVFYLALR